MMNKILPRELLLSMWGMGGILPGMKEIHDEMYDKSKSVNECNKPKKRSHKKLKKAKTAKMSRRRNRRR